MKPYELRRIWNDVARRVDEDDHAEAMSTVAFTVGFLLGGDNPYGAMMMLALAEQAFGHHPELTALKFKVGLAGHLEGAPAS
jgi:threonine/homoserine/homoserine lactone efflux protein